MHLAIVSETMGINMIMLLKKNPKELIQMIAKSQLAFYEVFDFLPRFYRPAYSHVNEGQIDLLKMHFQHLIRWNIDPQDWNEKQSSRKIVNHIMDNITNGDIIVLHETEKTVKYLPKLLKKLKRKKYQMVDLDTLMLNE